MPFKEIPHTADWCLRVWAEDLPSLFAEAARGMNHLSGLELAPEPEIHCLFSSTSPDPETHLVSFLSELIYKMEQEKTGFDQFSIDLVGNVFQARMKGAPVLSVSKFIKAVTYHNLLIQQVGSGWEVEIVFDV